MSVKMVGKKQFSPVSLFSEVLQGHGENERVRRGLYTLSSRSQARSEQFSRRWPMISTSQAELANYTKQAETRMVREGAR